MMIKRRIMVMTIKLSIGVQIPSADATQTVGPNTAIQGTGKGYGLKSKGLCVSLPMTTILLSVLIVSLKRIKLLLF